jgi:hypothetical protein
VFAPGQIQKTSKKSIANSSEVIKEHKPTVGISSPDGDGFKLIVQVWVNALNYNNVKIIQ